MTASEQFRRDLDDIFRRIPAFAGMSLKEIAHQLQILNGQVEQAERDEANRVFGISQAKKEKA